MMGGGVVLVLLVALATLFLTDSSPRAQTSSWADAGVWSTRRFQIAVVAQGEVLMIDGDTGDTWRLGQIGGGDKKEPGWTFLPRENPRSPK
jgi:hypothetical protein